MSSSLLAFFKATNARSTSALALPLSVARERAHQPNSCRVGRRLALLIKSILASTKLCDVVTST